MTPGTVVLLRFPFTHEEEWKKRPALIIGRTPRGASGDPALVVVMITGNARRFANPDPGDMVIQEWQAAGLLAPSVVRCRRFFSAEPADVLMELGTLDDATYERVRDEVRKLLGF